MVNKNLQNPSLPEKARIDLFSMECCLCSGDGISDMTAFRADNETIMDKVLGILRLREFVQGIRKAGKSHVVSFINNPMGVRSLYFCI